MEGIIYDFADVITEGLKGPRLDVAIEVRSNFIDIIDYLQTCYEGSKLTKEDQQSGSLLCITYNGVIVEKYHTYTGGFKPVYR